MSEVLSSFTERHMPTYSRWFSRAQLKKSWANRGLIVKYTFFGWLVPFKWLHDLVFEQRKWQLFTAAAYLPQSLHDLTTQVIKQTRLWRREKEEIAIELVSHFQDGLDSGKTAEELQSSFGDAKQAARLMRRAKKRCRPMWWQAWWWVSRGVALLACWYIVVGIWQYLAVPTIKTDYLAIVNKKAESWGEKDKAWPVYREAFREIDLVNFPEWFSEYYDDILTVVPGHKIWPDVEKWLDEKQHAFSQFREARHRPGLGFAVYNSDDAQDAEDRRVLPELNARTPEKIGKERVFEPLEKRELIGTLLPHIQPLRQAAYLLRLDALRAISHDDGATALANIEAILALSRHAEENQFIVNTFVAYVLQKIALQTVHDILYDHSKRWSDTQLKKLAHSIAMHQLHPERSWDNERYSFLDTCQRIYTDDGNGNGRLTKNGPELIRTLYELTSRRRKATFEESLLFSSASTTFFLPTINAFTASRREMTERYNEWHSINRAKLDLPLWEIGSEDPTWMTEPSEWEQKKYWLVTMIEPDGELYRTTVQINAGYQEGALIGIAMELYRRKHNEWPSALDQLVPQIMPTLAVDRFTGKPLVYKVVDDRPLIYSLGADDDDDGGAIPKELEGEWLQYRASSKKIWFEHQGSKNHKALNGDLIIWTLLPDHQIKPKPKDPDNQASPSDMNENESDKKNETK